MGSTSTSIIWWPYLTTVYYTEPTRTPVPAASSWTTIGLTSSPSPTSVSSTSSMSSLSFASSPLSSSSSSLATMPLPSSSPMPAQDTTTAVAQQQPGPKLSKMEIIWIGATSGFVVIPFSRSQNQRRPRMWADLPISEPRRLGQSSRALLPWGANGEHRKTPVITVQPARRQRQVVDIGFYSGAGVDHVQTQMSQNQHADVGFYSGEAIDQVQQNEQPQPQPQPQPAGGNRGYDLFIGARNQLRLNAAVNLFHRATEELGEHVAAQANPPRSPTPSDHGSLEGGASLRRFKSIRQYVCSYVPRVSSSTPQSRSSTSLVAAISTTEQQQEDGAELHSEGPDATIVENSDGLSSRPWDSSEYAGSISSLTDVAPASAVMAVRRNAMSAVIVNIGGRSSAQRRPVRV
ncbi:hypothetical protein M406DRAFT_71935 [Cryphonectria parasitica EP155]|uniref:Uncharacterized protein n=1 Tax=Cryphonectria parasitica (strain ATCC 38755 / EP155) TaxID=660469 RepID=A0A9P4Y907_CRYP1|nr:uncharacterized protein M406DRAFT_71935 [Cryphonectria parasitica EP155]KAF3768976.1 hypothetical protein M406DRAFT_71935 [Cryphonectria parasitica EP155]